MMFLTASTHRDGGVGEPDPQAFGLPSYYSPEEALADEASAKKWAERSAAIVFWAGYAVIAAIAFYIIHVNVIWLWFIFIAYAVAYLSSFRDKLHETLVARRSSDFASFLSAWRNWVEFETEAGLAYWQNQRGAEFEKSIEKFFRKRGWSAELTPASGDGGVDVILRRNGTTYWCQCKGHAKAIAVSEIRRIAGAALKGKGLAAPVIISANGFTRPALHEAEELNVICIDGTRLCKLASLNEIQSLNDVRQRLR